MTHPKILPVFWRLLLFLCFTPFTRGADEAERQNWEFKTQAAAWGGNGPLNHGLWSVRNGELCMQVRDATASPAMSQNELRLPGEKANVVQIRLAAAAASKAQLWFTTGISPVQTRSKMVEFELRAGADLQDYTLDLKNVPSWQDQIASLRFVFLGAKSGEEIRVAHVKVFDGEKISKPLLYSSYQLGEKPVTREFRLGSIFNDQMVLQREQRVPIWGRTLPGETVTVEFAGQRKSATADPKGKWEVVLESLSANSEPRTMRVSSPTQPPIELTGVLVGDVWLCSGQSNMGGSAFENPVPEDKRRELLDTDYPALRSVSVPALHRETPLPNDASEASLSWRPMTGKNRGPSAAAYFFGQSVHASQKIPIGLLCVIKAGSQIEQWIDEASLRSIFTDAELQASCSGSHLASGLFNGMVAPMHPFPIRGVFWYQGESNADNEARYEGYYKSLPAAIRMWRQMWGSGLPVLLVQLPSFDGNYPKESWAHIREAQTLSSALLPQVWTAVTFDEGDPKNLHPANKYFAGSRLGKIALSKVYGDGSECFGPTFRDASRLEASLQLRFDHVAGGLKAHGDLSGFELRGAEGSWHPAAARITSKDAIELSSAEVKAPSAARYGWKNAPEATLFNDLDLPAGPFRTDVPQKVTDAVKVAGAPPSPSPKNHSTLEVVAGGGSAVEGELATRCRLSQPFGIAFDPEDNMFICEETHRLLRVDAKTGILSVVSTAKRAGAPLGDGGPAADAAFAAPHNLVADSEGNLFIADTYHYAVRRVDAHTGRVSALAGNGTKELSGDGGPAASAGLDGIACLSFSRDFSALYLGGFSRMIRRVDLGTGVISTVAGIGGSRALTTDSKGNLFTAAGPGLRMLGPDGKSRLLVDSEARPPLNSVKHLWADSEDNILIADAGNHLIRKFIVAEGRLLTVAGTGVKGAAGVPGLPLEAQLGEPHGVTTHPRTGEIYIADSRNHRILKIRP